MNSTARHGSCLSLIETLIVLLATAWMPLAANAQSDSTALETLVVSGTRVPNQFRTTRLATVLDAAAIAARNDSNALDLLSDIPGVHVNMPGARGNPGELFIRGGEPNFTSVFIDGVQVNDPTNTRGGSFDFSTLNVNDIERVEVIRGPASSIYGSDALSGVINVVTRGSADTLSGVVDAESGNGDYRRGGLRVSGPVAGSSGFSLGLGIVEDGNNHSPDRFDGTSFTGKLDLIQDSPTTVSIYARHANSESWGFPDSSGGEDLAVIRGKAQRDTDDSSASVAVTSRLAARSRLHLSATHHDHDERVSSPGVAPGVGSGIPANRSDSDFSRRTLNIFIESALTPRVGLAAGVGYRAEDGESSGQIDFVPGTTLPTRYAVSRNVRSAYAEAGYRVPTGIGILAAVRMDDTAASGRETTGKIAFDYGFGGDRARVRLVRADAFKLPSLFALADPLVGNPNLRPESAESWEIGLDLQDPEGSLRWQFTAFKQRFYDLIDFDFATFTTVNRSQVETDGIEIGGAYDPTRNLALSAHLTYTEIDVINSDVKLRQRPDLRGGVGLLWRISEDISSHAALQYIGERYDSSIPTGQRILPSYTRLDLALTWELEDSLQLSVAIDNVGDASYEEAIGFRTTGRRARISIRKTFGESSR